jgi:hypothetical protein
MSALKEKYINPFTDYGFKRLFGEEPIKEQSGSLNYKRFTPLPFLILILIFLFLRNGDMI